MGGDGDRGHSRAADGVRRALGRGDPGARREHPGRQQWRDLYTEGALGKTRNEFLATLPSMGYEPGTQFRYNSGNTQVLAWMT